jgi:hypothetical protein
MAILHRSSTCGFLRHGRNPQYRRALPDEVP